MSASASFTKRPAKSVIRSSKVPSGLTGFWSVIPYCSPSRKSSSPKAIAVWTRPVALVGGDEVGLQHRVAPRAVVGDVGERRLVAAPGQGAARKPRQDLGALPEHSLDERRRHDQDLARSPPGAPSRTRSPVPRRRRRSRSGSRAWWSRREAGPRAPAGSRGCSRWSTSGASRTPRDPRPRGIPGRPRARTAPCRPAGSRGRPCSRSYSRPSSQILRSDHQTDSM